MEWSLINPIILWFVPFIIESLHVVGRAAQEVVAGQITDGFTFLLALLLGIPMTRYRLRLLAERRKKQNNQGEEASKQASKESQQQVLPLQSSQAEGGVSGKEK